MRTTIIAAALIACGLGLLLAAALLPGADHGAAGWSEAETEAYRDAAQALHAARHMHQEAIVEGTPPPHAERNAPIDPRAAAKAEVDFQRQSQRLNNARAARDRLSALVRWTGAAAVLGGAAVFFVSRARQD